MEWIETVLKKPIKIQRQPDGRIRHWGQVDDFYVRVVTLSDGETVQTAFKDSNFKDKR